MARRSIPIEAKIETQKNWFRERKTDTKQNWISWRN